MSGGTTEGIPQGMSVASLFNIFGDPPADSVLAARMKEFLVALQVDAHQGGSIGAKLRAFIEAGRNPADSAYRQLSPMEAAQAVGLCNALKGAL